MPQNPPPLPDFTRWPSFPFEGDMRVKHLAEPVAVEPPRSGEDASECVACNTPDDAYIWVSERWRVRGMDRPTGLPAVLILECRSHLDIGDLPNLLAAELGVMTVRLERAIRSLDGVARVHVNRWGDGSAHLHMWFLARPYGQLQLRGTFLSLWDDILPVIPEEQWLENLALVAEWLAGFGGRAIAEPPHIHWQSPSTFGNDTKSASETTTIAADPEFDSSTGSPATPSELTYAPDRGSVDAASSAARSDLIATNAETRDLSSYAVRSPTTVENDARTISSEHDSDGEPAQSGERAGGDEPDGVGERQDDDGNHAERGRGSKDMGHRQGSDEVGTTEAGSGGHRESYDGTGAGERQPDAGADTSEDRRPSYEVADSGEGRDGHEPQSEPARL